MTATDRALTLARAAAAAADDKLAATIVGLDVSGQLPLTDIFVIISAGNERQVGAIVDEVEERVRLAGAKVIRREGTREARWVLLDFGDIIVHVQHADELHFYDLERLWRDCPEVDLGTRGQDPDPDPRAQDPDSDTDLDTPGQDLDSDPDSDTPGLDPEGTPAAADNDKD